MNGKVIEHLDKRIKEVWLREVAKDYNDDHLLKEDALKCSFYYHLRRQLGDGWLRRHRMRIFPEYRLPRGHRVDIAVVRLLPKARRSEMHLSEALECIVAVLEFKYRQGAPVDPFYGDRRKLRHYAVAFPQSPLYAGFIHEDVYDDSGAAWFDGRQTRAWARGRVTELLGYWSQKDGSYATRVLSYNGLNQRLNSAQA